MIPNVNCLCCTNTGALKGLTKQFRTLAVLINTSTTLIKYCRVLSLLVYGQYLNILELCTVRNVKY